MVLAVVVTGIALSACASSFTDGDDANVGIGDGAGSATVLRVTVKVAAFAFDDYQVDETDLDTWLGPFGQAEASLPTTFVISGRVSSLVVEPVELGVDDVVHRVEARFEHNAALADLGIESAIDPPPDSLDG